MRPWLPGILLATSVASCVLVLSPGVGQLSFEGATFALAGIAFAVVTADLRSSTWCSCRACR